jgi:glycosyltransferase involved in cell wall biosynthesis
MKNKIVSKQNDEVVLDQEGLFGFENSLYPAIILRPREHELLTGKTNDLAEVLFITSYPPRECGIATYSQDLIKTLNNKFSNSLSIKVCALESGDVNFQYTDEVKYVLKTSLADRYGRLALKINKDSRIRIVLIQHEFGFFKKQEQAFLQFLTGLTKPVVVEFHTVLPHPDELLKSTIKSIATACESIIVMTHNSAGILTYDYDLPKEKISVIAHGTHLVPHLSKEFLKKKHGFNGKKILTTFGLLSSGKGIETTLKALPAIVKTNPDVLFIVIGKTHPEVLKEEGEEYRMSLETMVTQYKLTQYVKFINSYVTLPDLLEYLQLTDIYLFTTNDPNQAVSGTFAYAMSCGCPIISTPIPHAKEVLTEDTGIIFDFRDSKQLAEGVIRLLNDTQLRQNIRINTLQKIVPTAWENSAVEHTMLFKKIARDKITVKYNLPSINLNHVKIMTTDTGIIQFSKINQPDLCSGYTLDDNARASVAMCMHFNLTGDIKSIWYINRYLSFIKLCLQPDGDFLNYVDIENKFTDQNKTVNLDDANGRAIWALGYLISEKKLLPGKTSSEAIALIQKVIPRVEMMHSTRAMAFAIKGLYFYHRAIKSSENLNLVKTLANRLVQMYKHESNEKWQWFEGYLTYANSILPEALLYAWLLTGEKIYEEIARSSFNFLLSITFNEYGIEVISNKNWLQKGQVAGHFGEQPIDVAYTIMTLSKFYDAFVDNEYFIKMKTAFNWFLGNNRLHQIIYNPCTGGCYDGLEETHVNLNQGAESTISYLMARLTVEKYENHDDGTSRRQYKEFSENISKKEDAMVLSAMDNSSKQTSYYFIADPSGITRKKKKRSTNLGIKN